MSTWKLISRETIEVPIRSAGNTVRNQHISFEVFKDDTQYKAVPSCTPEQRVLGNIKAEILFSFQNGRAVAQGGIADGNQHLVERIGKLIKS